MVYLGRSSPRLCLCLSDLDLPVVFALGYTAERPMVKQMSRESKIYRLQKWLRIGFSNDLTFKYELQF